MVVKHVKRSALSGLVVAAIVVAIAAWSVMVPYAVSIDGKTVCYVRNKEEVGDMVSAVIKEYLPDNADLNAVQLSDNIVIERAGLAEALSADCVSVSVAASKFMASLESADACSTEDVKTASKKVNPIGIPVYAESDGDTAEEAAGSPAITIVSTAEVTETYKAKTEYIKDDSMLAGDAVIEAEGNKGQRDVVRQYTTVNGEILKTEDLKVEIVKEANPKIIRKGTIGLPEGKDWKTYDGDPIFNDGEVLIKTAQKYLGAPYKYGGYSLTHGIDCVQFIRQMYAKYGIKLPNGKNALKHVGTSVSFANAKPGDIICYSNHYALYMGNNTIIHATSKGGVKIRHNAKFRKIVTIRRIPRS